ESTPVVCAQNRGLRYGDGLFETMKMADGKILNEDFHFERLFHGMATLQFEIPKTCNKDFFLKKVNALYAKNNQHKTVRIRLMIFRSNGGIFDPENHFPNYIIESWNLANERQLNNNGLDVDVLPGVRKSCDSLSHLKSNNYLPYVIAGLYAKQNKLNDCIVLNSFERVCDTAIANIFIIQDKNIYTPPLSEGCVAGVMRRWMLEKFKMKNYFVVEKPLAINDLLQADEFFLTNSIYHLRWVKNFRDKNYENSSAAKVYNHILQTIYG
ncbi:MAG: aminotransferase class IV, partial [Bacteroidota bacterium]|nr:aminotransferase class IV [Bacteroidota bacterium]